MLLSIVRDEGVSKYTEEITFYSMFMYNQTSLCRNRYEILAQSFVELFVIFL